MGEIEIRNRFLNTVKQVEDKAEKAEKAEKEEKAKATGSQQSVFNEGKTTTGEGTKVESYDDWTQTLNDRGLKTTKVGQNEANFSNYGEALSDELKNEIINSFDCEQDYELQAKLAGLFSNTNYMDMASIKKACKELGINVSIDYTATSYIVDNKKGGQYANNKTDAVNGHISVYTFTDANGGEIKIADANGNGALETEELFMNEILTGVASDVEISVIDGFMGSMGGSSGSDSSVFDLKSETEDYLAKLKQRRISQEEYRQEREAGIAEFEQELGAKKERQAQMAAEADASETTGSKQTVTEQQYESKVATSAAEYQKAGFTAGEATALGKKKTDGAFKVASPTT